MTDAPDQLATTLREAYRACDTKPLSLADIDRYYVPFASRQNTLSDINGRLITTTAGDTAALLFTGHIGCGKSSELTRIAQHQQDDFLVVEVQIDETAKVEDLDYTDLYLIIIQQVEGALRHQGIRLDESLRKSFEEWFLEITKEQEEVINRSVNVEAEAALGAEAPLLAKFLFKITAQMRGSVTERQRIRQLIKPGTARLKTDTNLLLRDANAKIREKDPAKKGLLLILDWVDRCPPNIAKHLFFDYAPQLLELNCVIIYTVPIANPYAQDGVNPAFGPPHIVPMVNVYQYEQDQPDLDDNLDGLNSIVSMIEKRVDVKAVFEQRAHLLDMARASGGHVRHMMQMMQAASINALGLSQTKIDADNVTYAAKQLQFQFERSTPRAYYPELARVALHKDFTDDEIGRELLFSTAVLEYNGNNRWVYPHPLIRRSELFRQALANLQAGQ